MVSTRPPTSKSSSPFNNPLVTVPNAPITIGIIVTCMFHSFFHSLARSRYLSFFLHSFSFNLWSAGTAKLTILQVLFFLLIIILIHVRFSYLQNIMADFSSAVVWKVSHLPVISCTPIDFSYSQRLFQGLQLCLVSLSPATAICQEVSIQSEVWVQSVITLDKVASSWSTVHNTPKKTKRKRTNHSKKHLRRSSIRAVRFLRKDVFKVTLGLFSFMRSHMISKSSFRQKHAQTYTHTQSRTRTLVRARAHTHTHTHTHTHIYIYLN